MFSFVLFSDEKSDEKPEFRPKRKLLEWAVRTQKNFFVRILVRKNSDQYSDEKSELRPKKVTKTGVSSENLTLWDSDQNSDEGYEIRTNFRTNFSAG